MWAGWNQINRVGSVIMVSCVTCVCVSKHCSLFQNGALLLFSWMFQRQCIFFLRSWKHLMVVVYIFLETFIYLKGREGMREIFHLQVHSINGSKGCPRSKAARNQKLHPSLPYRRQGPKYLALIYCLPRHMGREMDQEFSMPLASSGI